MPTPADHSARPPSSADAARDILPAYRIAAREKAGRVRMFVLGPLLLFLLQAAFQFALKFLSDWLSRQDDPVAALRELSGQWEYQRLPEVRVGMARAAMGETGE